VIEIWRREYNEERPKKSLGGMTPLMYAKQLKERQVILNPGLQSRVLLKKGGVGITPKQMLAMMA
jgi:hypothetical protein